MLKDYIGNEIEIGDEVVYTTNYTNNTLSRGIVVGLSETMMTIEMLDATGTLSYGRREKKSASKAVVVAKGNKPVNNPEYVGGNL